MTLNDPLSTAIDQLKAYGLTTYAARTYLALVRLGEGTAREVSDVSDVPRTRVYDATDELRADGLIDVQHANPKRFTAVSAETTGRRVQREYDRRANELTAALEAIEPETRTVKQRGVWTVAGREHVTDRVVEAVQSADDDLVYATVGELATDPVVDALRAASGRGVGVRFGCSDPAVVEGVRDEAPEITPFESNRDWASLPIGRLLMADRRRTLVSVLVDGDDGVPEETAIWGSGETNSLVVVLKSLSDWFDAERP